MMLTHLPDRVRVGGRNERRATATNLHSRTSPSFIIQHTRISPQLDYLSHEICVYQKDNHQVPSTGSEAATKREDPDK